MQPIFYCDTTTRRKQIATPQSGACENKHQSTICLKFYGVIVFYKCFFFVFPACNQGVWAISFRKRREKPSAARVKIPTGPKREFVLGGWIWSQVLRWVKLLERIHNFNSRLLWILTKKSNFSVYLWSFGRIYCKSERNFKKFDMNTHLSHHIVRSLRFVLEY